MRDFFAAKESDFERETRTLADSTSVKFNAVICEESADFWDDHISSCVNFSVKFFM